MKTLRFLVLGLSAVFALAACGDDGGTTTTGTPGDGDGDGGGSGDGGAASTGTTPAVTGTGVTGSTGSGPCTQGTEDTMAACSDGCDNDADGFVDCGLPDGTQADFNCDDFCGLPGAPAENSNVTCSDGIDNDDNGFIDCEDNGCANRRACNLEEDPFTGESEGAADPNAVCTDRENNDGNESKQGVPFTDCGDFSCSNNWEVTACQDLPQERNSNALCSDGEDNDKDGLVDCDDPGCAFDGEPNEGIVVCGETVPPEDEWEDLANADCEDGVDNDGNGFADCDGGDEADEGDFGCTQNPSVTVCPVENTDALCSDGISNDDNDFIDCDDFSCSRSPNVTVCGEGEFTFANCTDGIDNDGNNHTDCDDFGCQSNRAACDYKDEEQ